MTVTGFWFIPVQIENVLVEVRKNGKRVSVLLVCLPLDRFVSWVLGFASRMVDISARSCVLTFLVMLFASVF